MVAWQVVTLLFSFGTVGLVVWNARETLREWAFSLSDRNRLILAIGAFMLAPALLLLGYFLVLAQAQNIAKIQPPIFIAVTLLASLAVASEVVGTCLIIAGVLKADPSSRSNPNGS